MFNDNKDLTEDGLNLRKLAEEISKLEYFDNDQSINEDVDRIIQEVKNGAGILDAVSPYITRRENDEGYQGGIITRLQAKGYDLEMSQFSKDRSPQTENRVSPPLKQYKNK